MSELTENKVVRISEVEGSIDSFSVLNDTEGYYHLIYGLTDYEDSENFKILYQKVGNVNDLVLKTVNIDETDYTNGVQKAVLYVKNEGIASVDGFTVEINENGYYKDSITVNDTLESGEEKEIEISFRRNVLSELVEYEFIAANSSDCDTTNNTVVEKMGYNDIAMSVEEYHLNNNVEIFAQISNLTERNSDVEFRVYEDSLDGEVVFSRDITSLTKENSQIISFTLDKSKMNVTPGKDKVYILTVASEEEIATSDNQYTLLVPTMANEVTGVEIEGGDKVRVFDYDDYKGKTVQLAVKTFPETVDATLTWESSKTSVATVNTKGVVTIKGAGTTVITAKVDEDTKATIEIQVVKIKKDAPANLTLESISIGEAKLKWDKLTDVNNY